MKVNTCVLLAVSLLVSNWLFAQTEPEINEMKRKADSSIAELKDSKIYTIVEEMPEYPGGKEAMNSYLIENLRYPESAMKDNIQGKVFVTFIVATSGKVEDVAVMRSIREDLDNEALRVVSAMPDWSPGKQKGKPVKVQYNLPVTFRK